METIKEEKKADLEQLLNSLIEKGWKPRGLNIMGKIVIDYDIEFAFDIYDSLQKGHWNFRELVSKESGLWQFCCENKIVKEDDGQITRIINLYKSDETIVDGGWDYHYWLMVCSILDESELEDFLLDNIKIEGEV